MQTPETNGEFWYEFSDGSLSDVYKIVFEDDRQTCLVDGYVNCTLDKPLRINEFQFPLTGQSRFGSSYANGSEEFIFDTMVHEFGHILGITSTWWKQNAVHRSEFANEDEWDTFMASSTHIPSYRGARANAFYKNVLNGSEVHIPIEQDYGAGSAGSHWDEAHFNNEMLSTAGSDGIDEKMSGMTIAALEDQGYPIRNGPKMGYDLTDAYSLPRPQPSLLVGLLTGATTVASPHRVQKLTFEQCINL